MITRDSIQEFLKVLLPSQSITVQYDDRLDSLEPMVELLGGSLNKKSMNNIPFNVEIRTLAYVMIHNLYPITNLTTLSRPRTIFLYDLYPHKEIDICGHVYHLLPKSITKRNTRTIIPFPTLIMGLIAKTRLKIPSGLTIVPRDYPIGANTVNRTKPTLLDPKPAFLKYQGIMLRKRVEILKKKLIGSLQLQKVLHNHPPKHKHGDLNALIVSWQG